MKERCRAKNKLKIFRVLFSIVIFACFLLLFLGSEKLVRLFADKLPFLQFVPSVVNFFLSGSGLALGGLLFVLLLTFLFGRVYCCFLCPLGIFHDFVIFVRRWFGGKNKGRAYHKPLNWVRYFILAVVALSAVFGTVSLINLLDPFSIFARGATVLFNPVATVVRNLLIDILGRFEIYWLWPRSVPPISVSVLAITSVFFAAITVLALWKGRWYCNTICPVGTVLGIVSRWSLFKVRIKTDACISCDKCEKICSSNCIDVANKTVDMSRCVGCFDCLGVCPKSAVEYLRGQGEKSKEPLDYSRRRLLTGSVLSGAALALAPAAVRATVKNNNSDEQQHPVMPPGAVNRSRFCDRCTGCGLCVSACPEKAIKQAFMQYGLEGLMVPVLDYKKGYCDYECNLCGQVCPTGAIKELELAEKKLVQIGKVQLIKDNCVTHKKDKDCGACAEGCPTHAVYTVVKNNVRYPEINAELCIGCGVCENMCPKTPKAIIVDGVEEQGKAKEPFYDAKPTPPPQQERIDEDFPF